MDSYSKSYLDRIIRSQTLSRDKKLELINNIDKRRIEKQRTVLKFSASLFVLIGIGCFFIYIPSYL
jgi:hypothetical protein